MATIITPHIRKVRVKFTGPQATTSGAATEPTEPEPAIAGPFVSDIAEPAIPPIPWAR